MASAQSEPPPFHGTILNPRNYSRAEWHAKKPDIKQLYIDFNQTLEQVMTTMSREHNFHATRRMYVTRLKAWGLAKNYTKTRVFKLLHEKRESGAVSKASKFGDGGKRVDIEKIEKYLKRKNKCLATFLAEEVEDSMRTGYETSIYAPPREDREHIAQQSTRGDYEDNCPYQQSAKKFRLIEEFPDGTSYEADSFGLHSYIAVDEKRPCTALCFCRQHKVSTDLTFLVYKSSSGMNITFFSNALYSKLIELVDLKTLDLGIAHQQKSLNGLALLGKYYALKAYLDTFNSEPPNSPNHSLFSELQLLVDGFLSDGDVFKSLGYEELYERGFLDFKLWKKFQQDKLQRDISALEDCFLAIDDSEDELIPPIHSDILDLDPVEGDADFDLASGNLYLPLVDLPYPREEEMPNVIDHFEKLPVSLTDTLQNTTWSPGVEHLTLQPDNSAMYLQISVPEPPQQEDTSLDKELSDAAETGNFEQVQSLIDRGANVNPKSHHLLVKAARNGHLDIVELLLDQGAGASRRRLSHALVEAASGGHPQVTLLLVDWRAEINPHLGYKTPLIGAVKSGHVAITKLLLDLGVDVNAYAHWRRLHHSIGRSSKERKYRNSAVTPRSWSRSTWPVPRLLYLFSGSISRSSKSRTLTMVQLLLDRASHRLDRVIFDNWVTTLVRESHYYDNYLQQVLENVLVLSATNGQRRIMDLLLRLGVSINAMTELGTPLSSSARAGHESIVRWLLRKGADIQDAAIFLQTHGLETTVARLFEIEGKIRVEDAGRGARLSFGYNAEKVKNLRCLRSKFVAQHLLMLQKAEISSTGFRMLGQEFWSYRKLWSAGIKTLRMLCYGQMPTNLGNTMAFLCLARAITETLKIIDSRDRSDQFLQDLKRWELLFASTGDLDSYREAIYSMWLVSKYQRRYFSHSSFFYPNVFIGFSQLASMLINEARGLLELDNVKDTGLESSQHRWRLRDNNTPLSEISADPIPEFHPPREGSGPPPEIIHPQPSDPSFYSTTRTLSEEVKADVSTVVKPMVILLMVGAIIAIVIMFLQWLRSVSTASISNPTIFDGVSTLQECCWTMERYMGLKGYSTWIPEHSTSLGEEVAHFNDFSDSALYSGDVFSC